MPNSAGFAVTVKLIDFATGPLAKVNKAIEGIEKNAKRAAREGGLFEARDALTKMRKEATEVADKFGQIFTPLGGLGAAGSLAGMVSLAERFARTGTQLSRTSSMYSASTDALQKWAGAQRLAGGNADDAVNSIKALSNSLYMARAGLNQTAIQSAIPFHLDISKKPTEFLEDLADRVKNDPRLRNNTDAQRRLLANFGISEEMLPLLQRGRQGLHDYFEEVKKHGTLSQWQLDQASALEHAYTGLTMSVESMGHAIGAQMGTWLTPMLKSWSTWLDDARETPGVMKSVETGVEVLGGVMAVSLVGSLTRIAWWSNKIWALPLWKLLTSPAGAAMGGAGAFLYGMWPSTAGNQAEIDAEKNLARRAWEAAHPGIPFPEQSSSSSAAGWVSKTPSATAPGEPPVPAAEKSWWQRLREFVLPEAPAAGKAAAAPKAPSALGSRFRRPIGAPAGETIQHGIDFFTQKGLTREQATGVVARLAAESGGGTRLDPNAVNASSGAYGIAQWLGNRKPAALATKGDLDAQLNLVWQEFQTSEANSFARIQRAKTAHEAAVSMEGFERAGNPSFTEWAGRVADRIFGIGHAQAAERPQIKDGDNGQPFDPNARNPAPVVGWLHRPLAIGDGR